MLEMEWLERLLFLKRTSGGSELITDSFTDTYTITNGKRIQSLVQYGKCVQSDTPTPSAPVDIKCNNGTLKYGASGIYVDGTSEVITVNGKNIFNKDDESRYLNVFVNSNTNAIAQGTTQWCFSIPCKPNTTYTLSGMSGTSRWGSFTSKDIGTVATSVYAGNGTITTGANDKWLVGLAYAQSQTGWIDYRDTLQIEVGSTPTEYEPYREQTAHAENLFAVKNQIDTQDIISGTVTRRCAVKVFNGTEDWREATNAGVFYVDLGLSSSSGYIYDAISTHFTSDPVANANMGDMTCKVANSNAFGIAFHVCNRSLKRDLDGFKAWVASLYANGTPIIAVYPTAKSTIESVTAQSLPLTGESDTLSVTAEVSGINFDIEYYSKV